MPTYQYACTACDHRFEAVQSFSDAALTECPTCSGKLRKVFSSVGIVFKGSGFYRTDSRAGASATAPAKSENGSTKTESGSSGSAGSDSSGNGSSSGSSSGSSESGSSGSSASKDTSGSTPAKAAS